MVQNDLLTIPLQIMDYSKLNILFGKRGYGKTTFLIQTALTSADFKRKILILPNRKRDIEIFCRLARYQKKIEKKPYVKVINNLSDLILILAELSKQEFNEQTLILLDDVFPIQFYAGREWNRALAAKIGIIIALLIEILNKKTVVWISLPEHSTIPLPRRWLLFIEFTNKFYRLWRERRLRELYAVNILYLPSLGEPWKIDLKELHIEMNLLAKFILTHRGFLRIEKEE